MAFQSSNEIQLDKLLTGNRDQLGKLLALSFPIKKDDSRQDITTEELVQLLHKTANGQPSTLADHIEQNLKPTESLLPKDYSILKFIDRLFLTLTQQNTLDNKISTLLNKLAAPSACCFLQDSNWLWNTDHILHTSITAIHKFSIGWHSGKSKAADRFYPKLEQLITEISQATDTNSTDLAAKKLLGFFDNEHKRTEKLEERLRAAEAGSLRAQHAQQKSTRLLNQNLAGKQLPTDISQFIKTHWRDSLISLLIQFGTKSPEWNKAQQVTESLINSFEQTNNSEDKQQAVYAMIAGINDDLRKLTVSLSHDESRLNHELDTIDQYHLSILKGEAPRCEPFELIDNTNPLNISNAKVSSSLLAKTELFSEGQWFIHDNADNSPSRIKLMTKLPDIQQVLFSNRLGIKAEQYGLEEFAYKLSTKSLTPIRLSAEPRASAMMLITQLFENYDTRKRKVTDLKAELKKAKEIAKKKALKEADALRSPKTIKPELKKPPANINVDERVLYDKLSKLLTNLNIGNKIIFRDKEGNTETCKLAVKLQSTGKYIFINNAGLKKYELSYINLLNQLITEKAKLVEEKTTQDLTNTDPLTQVVNRLRQKDA
jgi:hypothetical protein